MPNQTTNRPRPKPSNWGMVEKMPVPKTASNMKNIFETGNFTDIRKVEKTKIEIKTEEGAGEFENTPEYLKEVVRESDVQEDGITAGQGKTAKLLNYWVDPNEKFTPNRTIRVAEDEGITLENQPIVRSDVIRETDADSAPMPTQGMAKQLNQKWLNQEDRPVEKTPIDPILNEDERKYTSENNPVYLDNVVRESDINPDELQPCIPQKVAGEMRSMFDSGDITDLHGVEKTTIELKNEQNAGVYENQPDYAQGVVRESDYNEELVPIIPERHARQMKQLWYDMAQDKGYAPKREQVRFTPEREITPP